MERSCQCGGTHDERELGVQYNLYQKIDLQNVECLNELTEGSGVKVFKPWEERLDHTKVRVFLASIYYLILVTSAFLCILLLISSEKM